MSCKLRCCRTGSVDMFEALSPRAVSGLVISLYAESLKCAAVVKVLDELEAAGLSPDHATWLNLLDSARYQERPDVAQQVRFRG